MVIGSIIPTALPVEDRSPYPQVPPSTVSATEFETNLRNYHPRNIQVRFEERPPSLSQRRQFHISP